MKIPSVSVGIFSFFKSRIWLKSGGTTYLWHHQKENFWNCSIQPCQIKANITYHINFDIYVKLVLTWYISKPQFWFTVSLKGNKLPSISPPKLYQLREFSNCMNREVLVANWPMAKPLLSEMTGKRSSRARANLQGVNLPLHHKILTATRINFWDAWPYNRRHLYVHQASQQTVWQKHVRVWLHSTLGCIHVALQRGAMTDQDYVEFYEYQTCSAAHDLPGFWTRL